MRPRGKRWLVAAYVLATAAPALGDSTEAKDHIQRGIELYERGEIDASIAELELANRIEVTAEGCYALGQAQRKKGDCAHAIPSYRCAVERAPSEAFARAANYQIGRCVIEGGLTRDPAEPVVVVRPTPPPVVPEAQPRWYRDLAGGVLLGVGLGVAGSGGGLLLHAEMRANAAREDLDSYRAADSVGTERIAGAIALSLGGALIVSSIVRYAIVAQP